MTQLLATRYSKHIACFLLLFFFISTVVPVYGMRNRNTSPFPDGPLKVLSTSANRGLLTGNRLNQQTVENAGLTEAKRKTPPDSKNIDKADIGGPAQPEMSRFKSASADNLVNIFTGDFSYNIPLLDVGGYPVNIFYDGGISPEQEASWVGLGWNINPGTVGRNMRGVPDDFNGTEKLQTTQSMKPNITWGGRFGADFEVIGIKEAIKADDPVQNDIGLPLGLGSLGGSIGLSLNNYLGPALDLGVKGGTSFPVAKNVMGIKNASLNVGVSLGANLSSRGGLTISPGASLSVSKDLTDRKASIGVGLSTSYNSRNGISDLNINGQTSFNKLELDECGEKFVRRSSIGLSLVSTSISFARPSYIPSIRMPITNEAFSGHFQLGGGLWGLYVSGEAEVYKQTASVDPADVVQKKPLVGYLYYEKANGNGDAIVDFTRFNDNEVTPNTPVISVPQYSYDVFSINGEGTGGSIRLYRNDYGSVRDNYTKSRDKSLTVGVDIGYPGHVGANINVIKTPTTSGEWNEYNKITTSIPFTEPNQGYENVYFRNPGETSVLSADQYDKIGGADLVRFKLGGSNTQPSIEPVLERFSSSNKQLTDVSMTVASSTPRKKRTQVVSYLTAEEAAKIGLNGTIKNYDATTPLTEEKLLKFQSIPRVSEYRLPHHISQINVTEANGTRYVYDLPVYNKVQQDFTFTVGNPDPNADLINVAPGEDGINSPWLNKNSAKDGYLQVNETPAYAHSFLLGGLLSPDYVDVSGDGITEDDLGTSVKFNYTRTKVANSEDWLNHKWRTPQVAEANKANFNAGTLTNDKDNKGIISYGERESWYLHSIESKTMIALFTLEDRKDGKGVTGHLGGRDDNNASAAKRLKKIDLYSKADLKKNGLAAAKPIKTVFFEYSYKLCPNSPDNNGGVENLTVDQQTVNVNANKGKLTLERIYFTFNGQSRQNKNQYKFAYENTAADNPAYAINTSDRWGTYKPVSVNPGGVRNIIYPYSFQPGDENAKTALKQQVGAWGLKKILLPSGGQIEVEYESDDYAFVQNRRAATMMSVAGFGKNNTSFSDALYSVNGVLFDEHNYVLINVPDACTSEKEVLLKYLQGVRQLAFKLFVKMPKGFEYINSYAEIDLTPGNNNYGVYGVPTDKKIWVKLKTVNNYSPLSLSALEFLKEQLPGQAYPGYDVSDGTTLEQLGGMVEGLIAGLKNAFTDPMRAMRLTYKARHTDLSQCFVRLNDPDGYKYGGGHRVKKVVLKDNWNVMKNQYVSQYGTEYDYTTTEIFNGQPRTISSGVASYEPSIGGDENPFQEMAQVLDRLPLGPSSYGSVEMPILDAFFPAPLVGYSKVTVRSLQKGDIPQGMKSRSGVGRQVTEFYTAKDFPVYYQHTMLDPASDKQQHKNSFGTFFWKWALDTRALSQGFLVATNDMHGKMKSQSSYAENDPATRISYTENFYRNTGANGMNDKFDFVHASLGGEVQSGNMGIDIELMTDTRQFAVKSKSVEVQAQWDLFPVLLPAWLPFVWPVFTKSENIYRAVTCTKVISYHSIVDKVVVIDKGSKVSTENLVYDAETGEVIVNRTNNEFDKPIYSVNYPAYWAYSGMGLAYKNIDAVFSDVNFQGGKITSGNVPDDILESGDELYLIYSGDPTGCTPEIVSSPATRLWAIDKNKNTTSLASVTHDYLFIDENGKPYTRSNVKFRIVRSGKRNILQAPVASVTTMTHPVRTINEARKLVIDNTLKVVDASAIEYKEKWQTDNDVFGKFKSEYNEATCAFTITPDCTGDLEKSINPYRKGLLGTFRVDRSLVFYGTRAESNPTAATNILQNGFLANFKLHWDFDASTKFLVPDPDIANSKWVWNNQVTRMNTKGMELETKNALDIYTSAQYGYNKTMPIAIVNNSRNNEMNYEGFEDDGYNESLNLVTLNPCAEKSVNWYGIPNSAVVNLDNLSVNAHSGKNALQISANAIATKQLPVSSSGPEYSYLFDYLQGSTGNLNEPGVTITSSGTVPSSSTLNITHLSPANGLSLQFFQNGTATDCIPGGNGAYHRYHFFTVYSTHYIEIPSCGVYSLKGVSHNGFSQAVGSYSINIYDDANNLVPKTYTGSSADGIERYYQASLRNGKYRIECVYNGGGQRDCEGPQNPPCVALEEDPGTPPPPEENLPPNGPCTQTAGYQKTHYFRVEVTTITAQAYKNTNTQTNCVYALPIPAKNQMLNPIFNLQEGKKMLFSAWVRENCGNAQAGQPCNTQTFSNSKVQLSFPGSGQQAVEIKPVGPIIEGWQRMEGDFTVPTGATTANVSFVNNSSESIYFDDIRIHPFNANMTSYVYDPINLRLKAQLDANNYASYYEYDEEGGLIRTKVETKEGVKTINETRSAKQKTITDLQ